MRSASSAASRRGRARLRFAGRTRPGRPGPIPLPPAGGGFGRGRLREGFDGAGRGRGWRRRRLRGGGAWARRDQVSGQGKAGGEGAEADVKGLQRRLKAKVHRVTARREKDAAHEVIAAQNGGGLLIDPQFPIRGDAVV